jgi:hypothetical protein
VAEGDRPTAAVIPLQPVGPDQQRPGAVDFPGMEGRDELDRLHADLRALQAAFAAAFVRLDAEVSVSAGGQEAVRRQIDLLARRLKGGFAAQDALLTHFLQP